MPRLLVVAAALASSVAHAKHRPACREADLEVKRVFLAEGVHVIRNFFNATTLDAIRGVLEGIVDDHAHALARKGELSPVETFDDLDFTHKYAALYADHVATAGRSKLALPTYFRKEAHTAAFYDGFLANERLRELVGCLLATNDLRLYPVYMARGKVPDALSLGAHTVDWHQDAEYTYYWYSPLNTTVKEMDRYATSIVNTWLAVEDVPLDLGPMQLLKNPVRRLTKAELLQNDGREALRVSQIDEYVAAHPDDVVTASINKGDLVIFDQYAYHRALPNTSPNRTRWSLDFRFQRADRPTLRGAKGFLLSALKSGEDWAKAPPSPRLHELRKMHPRRRPETSRGAAAAATWIVRGDKIAEAPRRETAAHRYHQKYGGHTWAEKHDAARQLRGAVDTCAEDEALLLRTAKRRRRRRARRT